MPAVPLEPDESTASAVSSPHLSTADSVFGIAWVHPEAKFTPLREGRLIFGRGDGCDVRLEGSQVSRKHASAMLRGPAWVLVDEQSKNGVFVDGVRVDEQPLSGQAVVRIGEWVGVVTQLDAEGATSGVVTRVLAPGAYGGPALTAVFRTLATAASSNISVVLTGETGTGKEVLAHELHALSRRRGKLIAVNCAALPQHLAEGELFGYRKGAFTGAERNHQGYLRAADGGTLFLDEIPDLDLAVQAKLLRALDEHSVVPLGETQAQPVDLRVIAASQSSLHHAVEEGRFRADLLARLSGLEVQIPPLRQRREDVVPLFLAALAGERDGATPQIGADLAERLCNYDWPLNVREVVQAARRAGALHGDEALLTPEHLPARIRDHGREPAEAAAPARRATTPQAASDELQATWGARRRLQQRSMDEKELEALIAALRECKGNVSQAAKRLGISRQRAYRLLDQRPELDVDGEPPGGGEGE